MGGSAEDQAGSGQEPSGKPVPETPQSVSDPSAVKGLPVYRPRPGEEGDLWTKDFGIIRIPQGWEFLPRGDAFVTRRVKKGPHWVLWGQYNKKGGYAPVKGVFAPAAAIEEAQATAGATKTKREQSRPKAARQRERAETQYRRAFEEACVRFLNFAPNHRELAQAIASKTAATACQKYSGRVGRTSLLDLDEKAALAVRAYVRHNHTDYDSNLPPFDDRWSSLADDAYREARAMAHAEVDRFLKEHRTEV